jgi:hypothetical protein
MSKRSDDEEKRFHLDTLNSVAEFNGGDPNAILGMLLSMTINVLLTGHGNADAAANAFEGLARSVCAELRNEVDTRNFEPKRKLH